MSMLAALKEMFGDLDAGNEKDEDGIQMCCFRHILMSLVSVLFGKEVALQFLPQESPVKLIDSKKTTGLIELGTFVGNNHDAVLAQNGVHPKALDILQLQINRSRFTDGTTVIQKLKDLIESDFCKVNPAESGFHDRVHAILQAETSMCMSMIKPCRVFLERHPAAKAFVECENLDDAIALIIKDEKTREELPTLAMTVDECIRITKRALSYIPKKIEEQILGEETKTDFAAMIKKFEDELGDDKDAEHGVTDEVITKVKEVLDAQRFLRRSFGLGGGTGISGMAIDIESIGVGIPEGLIDGLKSAIRQRFGDCVMILDSDDDGKN